MGFDIFRMERWQSTYEHEVDYNLSESGVEPVRFVELLKIAAIDPQALEKTALEYNHSRGSPALRQRVASLYPGATEANVVVTAGGAEANFVTSWTLFEPGDEIVFMSPNYMQIAGLARNFGASVVAWPLVEDDGWQPEPGAIDRLVCSRTKVILVTNPNNPTGAVLSEAAMDEVVAAADRVGAWIVADEIYRGAERDGSETPTFWGRYARVIITSGLSKAYGLPGLRVGWLVAPEQLIEDLWAHKDYTTISVGPLNDYLATAALSDRARPRLLERTRGILDTNWPILEEWLSERRAFFTWHAPRAGAIAYVRYDLPIESMGLAQRLRREVDCLIVPGEQFEMGPFARFGFGPEASRLRAGLDRCATVFDAIASSAAVEEGSLRPGTR